MSADIIPGDMLAAFCKALEIDGLASRIKRFVLICGAKQYGVALGRTKIPMIEEDPWYATAICLSILFAGNMTAC